MFGKLRRVHFVGIGGVGMSGIALLLHNLGFEVSGSDVKESETTTMLRSSGITVHIGHRPENCMGADVIVYSSAVAPNNPELVSAKLHQIPVIPRAEMLAELMRMKYAIAVSGTHGKTTVTSLIAAVLEAAHLDPTTVIGGRILGTDAGARLGKGEYLVAEADESDRSFLILYPTLAVITNIEREHLDVYRNLGELKRAFVSFANRVPFYGMIVASADSPAVRQILPKFQRRFVSYGLHPTAYLRATRVMLRPFGASFRLVTPEGECGEFNLNLGGVHNVQNALAVLAIAMELGIDLEVCARVFETFTGIHRRLELCGERGGVIVMDDYGHHPTEILRTLQTLRHAYPDRRIIVVFQPHRYTRTKLLARDFRRAFVSCDIVVMLPIYAASEPPIPGVTNQLIAEAIRMAEPQKPIFTFESQEDAVTWLRNNTQAGDVVITQGAGNVREVGRCFLEQGNGRNL